MMFFTPACAISLFLVTICLLTRLSSADLVYTDPTDNCVTDSANGQGIWCCNGACQDGTSILDKTGLCKGYNNACTDPATVPKCSPNQVYTNVQDLIVDAGIGQCYVTGCTWQYDRWSYRCCDCPAGFFGYRSTCDGPEGRYVTFCVGCNGIGETLSYDPTNGYACTTGLPTSTTSTAPTTTPSQKQQLCHVASEFTNAVSDLALLSTIAGGLCQTDLISVSAIVTVAEYMYSVAQAYTRPSGGFTGTVVGAAISYIATVSTFTLGAAFVLGTTASLPEEAVFAAFYKAACNVNTAFGAVLTVVGAGLQQASDLNCPQKISKRSSISDVLNITTTTTTSARLIDLISQRAATPVANNCSDFISRYPANYNTAVTQAHTACQKIKSIDATQAYYDPIVHGITALQQFCKQYESSGQDALFVDFANLLKAAQKLEPYCTNVPVSVSSSSKSKSKSTSTTTSKPASTSKSSTLTTKTSNSSKTTIMTSNPSRSATSTKH